MCAIEFGDYRALEENKLMKDELINKINNKDVKVAVIGCGYVGLPLAVECAKSGVETIGFDIVEDKVRMINAGVNYIGDVSDGDLIDVVNRGNLRAVSDYHIISQVDVVVICVPTPLDRHQQPDIKYVRESLINVGKFLHKGMTIVLESTTYPGTTTELARPLLEESGLICERDFYLGFSPERIDPGNSVYHTKNTPKVVGGIGKDATDVIDKFYRMFLDADILKVSSPEVAEMGKILENTYRNINVGLVNELAMLCNKMGIDIWEVIEVAKTKPYGFQAFYPGPGLGGHCIPIDPYYLTWKAREYGFHTSMIESAMMINDRMPEYCTERTGDILNKLGVTFSSAKILMLGVAYKADINDYRESPAIEFMLKLREKGCSIDYYDPYIQSYEKNSVTYIGIDGIDDRIISGYDLIIIATGHKKIDYNMVQKSAKYIFDVRNATKYVDDKTNIELL